MSNPFSEADFRGLLHLERACAQRSGTGFCLLVFDVGEKRSGEDAPAAIVRAASKRLRSTDAMGWLGPKQLAILLPDTGEAEAQALGAEIRSRATADGAGAIEVHPSVRPFHPEPDDASRARTLPRPDDRPAANRGASERVSCDPNGVFSLLERPLPRWKRILDVLLALGGVVILSPLIFLIAVTVKATSRGRIIYEQERTGQALRRFRIYKFRTMRRGSHRQQKQLRHMNQMSGPLFKTDSDPRLTPVGNLLRRTSLDELPQLLNVLKGEMTLLGPRALSPPPAAYEPWQLRRFTVVPGVACTWQATRRSETDFVSWMRSDLAYVDRETSWLHDLRLLARTVWSVLTCAGGR